MDVVNLLIYSHKDSIVKQKRVESSSEMICPRQGASLTFLASRAHATPLAKTESSRSLLAISVVSMTRWLVSSKALCRGCPMSLSRFLASILNEGSATIPPPSPLPEPEQRDAQDLLREFEQQYRLELPDEPPPLDVSSATWATIQFYRASQFVVFRDVSAADVDQALSADSPNTSSPSIVYSVDLVFRFLPDLVKLARSASEDDPLHRHLMRWAREWPLSSVGMPNLDNLNVEAFIEHPCLRKLYVDRILAKRDFSRLSSSQVRDEIQQVLGAHSELAPDVAEALQSRE